jgi:hypothetical protein
MDGAFAPRALPGAQAKRPDPEIRIGPFRSLTNPAFSNAGFSFAGCHKKMRAFLNQAKTN